MTPEQPSQPDWDECPDLPRDPPRADPRDQPIDAQVIEPPPIAWHPSYPYGSPPFPPAGSPFGPHRLTQPQDWLGIQVQKPEYVVPQRFGMSAIWGIMTLLCLVYGGMHWLDAWPVFYLFIAVQVLLVCGVQMVSGEAPRLASAISGAVLAPLFAFVSALFAPGEVVGELLCLLIPLALFGALVGYLTGTCAAGVFLIMDKLEPWLNPASQPSTPKLP
ncbi:MAG: hypothetical protein SFU86_19295 [Pirellulaceae bacterium]|nr:hypothetical protein [Pirellulaceae bacterium]